MILVDHLINTPCTYNTGNILQGFRMVLSVACEFSALSIPRVVDLKKNKRTGSLRTFCNQVIEIFHGPITMLH